MDQVWRSALLGCTNHFIVRDKQNDPDTWYFTLAAAGLGHLGWPAKVFSCVDGQTLFAADLGPHVQPVSLLFVLDHKQWEARTLEMRSPLWFLLRFPAEQAAWSAQRGRVFGVAGEPSSLLTTCARLAFGDVPKTVVQKLADEQEGLEVPASSSLYTLVFKLVKHVLKCDEEEALKFCEK